MIARKVVLILLVAVLASIWWWNPFSSAKNGTSAHHKDRREQNVARNTGLEGPFEVPTRIADVHVSNHVEEDDAEIADDQELISRGSSDGTVEAGTIGTTPERDLLASFNALQKSSSARERSAASKQESSNPRVSGETDDGRTNFTANDAWKEGLSGDYFPGVRVSRSVQSGAAAPGEDLNDDSDTTQHLPWAYGQARGYAMLYAMFPQARPVVERQVSTLLKARIREPYISVLVDGTFGQDAAYLKSVIRRLSQGGRALTLALYLTNGSTMRKWKYTPIRAPFVTIEPVEFRNRIRRDRDIRSQYQELVRFAQDIFQFSLATNRGNHNVAVVMLEDNLQRQSYGDMRALAQPLLGGLATFVRNPCLGCYRGNDMDSLGDSREEHALNRFSTLAPGDSYTLDGVGFAYPNEVAAQQLGADQLVDLMTAAYERGLRWFGLWRHGWQGVVIGEENKHPEQRSYAVSTDTQADFEITALRAGLPQEVSDEEAP